MINGLLPEDNFTADSVRLLQQGAAEIVRQVNKLILEEAKKGSYYLSISFGNVAGLIYPENEVFLDQHFEERGFIIEHSHGVGVIIKW